MKHAILFVSLYLIGCGPSPPDATGVVNPASAGARSINLCPLVENPEAIFGRSVVVAHTSMLDVCQWVAADAVVTANVIAEGSNTTNVINAAREYHSTLEPTAQGSEVTKIDGIGDLAAMVTATGDTQIFFRYGDAAINVAASSSDPNLSSEHLAREIASAIADGL